jgi:hypothetical protein
VKPIEKKLLICFCFFFPKNLKSRLFLKNYTITKTHELSIIYHQNKSTSFNYILLLSRKIIHSISTVTPFYYFYCIYFMFSHCFVPYSPTTYSHPLPHFRTNTSISSSPNYSYLLGSFSIPSILIPTHTKFTILEWSKFTSK